MKIYILIFCLFLISESNYAQFILQESKNKVLDINNVEAKIYNQGNFLFDEINYRNGYQVADDFDELLVFSGAIMVSAKDDLGNYFSSGYPYSNKCYSRGPIEMNGFTNDSIAEKYDRIWKINRWEIKEFIQKHGQAGYIIPKDILEYPAHSDDASHLYYPFRDVNGDGEYNALDGDYPEYNLDGILGCNDPKLYGDQTILWIINDMSGPNNTTSLVPLGINIFCQAFAYQGSESIDNGTFYDFRIENMSSNLYDSLYFSIQLDADLVCYNNDYVGSDVPRGLGYSFKPNYTGLSSSSCQTNMGYKLPALGLDFVKGPLAKNMDGIDNNRNGIIDEQDERLMMTSFSYWASGSTNPQISGVPNLDFNLAKNGSSYYSDGTPTSFAMSDSTDIDYWYSTEGVIPNAPFLYETGLNSPGSRFFLASIGAITLHPNTSESIIMAIPYARDTTGDNIASVIKLKAADDTLQMLADNCFDVGCQPFQERIFVDKLTDKKIHFAYAQDADSYSWDFGDGSAVSGQFPVHTYSAPGIYTVCVTVSSACSNLTTCDDVTISTDMLNLGTVDIIRIEGEGNGGNQLILKQSSIDQMFAQDSNRIFQPVYEGDNAPIKVEVINPYLIQSGNYQIAFDGVDSLSGWKMYKIGATDTVYSNMSLNQNNRQVISQWGVAVTVKFNEYEGNFKNVTSFLSQNKAITSPSIDWLSGVEDRDIATPQNWIRSGTQSDTTALAKLYIDRIGYDTDEVFEEVFDGTFAPYGLVASGLGQVMEPITSSAYAYNGTKNASSIRLVYSQDQSKWSRSPVLETSFDPNSNPYGDEYLRIKHAPSKDKNGNNESSGTGMSWFPGYAIDIETGERLNIAFGESSDLISDNGNDMWFNPTDVLYDSLGNEIFGGKHYVFVFGNYAKRLTNPTSMAQNQGYYDDGEWLETMLKDPLSTSNFLKTWRSCTWVTIPLLRYNNIFLTNDVTLDIRNAHPHQKYSYAFTDTLNNGNPLYQFALYPSVSVEEQIQQISHIVYPNPATGIFTIELADMEEYQMLLFNTAGQIVKTVNIYNGKETVDISNQANGLYHYYIYSEKGGMFGSGKVLKQ